VYAGWPDVRAGLEALGIIVLVNRAVERSRRGASFWIAGTGDPAAGGPMRDSGAGPDIERTLAGIPRGAFTIALAHNPALFPALAQRGVPLTLSGHTHYGQISVPWLGWSLASSFLHYAMGAHRLGGSLLYISPGTNYWGIPVRLRALHEVTVVTLRRARGDQREPAIEASPPAADRSRPRVWWSRRRAER
jgi:predicted MPP superfamily phosphohydrolase